MKGIADTGLIVALLNRDDSHHKWALEIARMVSEPLLTCESVLSEAGFQVGSIPWVLDLVREGFLEIAFDLSKNFEEIAELGQRYRDRTPDLADLCLIRMSELHGDLPVLTVDEKDFRVYRKNGRDVIPIVCPPRS
ncbi:MAG: PIN domain-containing protein [Terriglobales bacterium]|jgi:predicted nucleic acid-binding protein